MLPPVVNRTGGGATRSAGAGQGAEDLAASAPPSAPIASPTVAGSSAVRPLALLSARPTGLLRVVGLTPTGRPGGDAQKGGPPLITRAMAAFNRSRLARLGRSVWGRDPFGEVLARSRLAAAMITAGQVKFPPLAHNLPDHGTRTLPLRGKLGGRLTSNPARGHLVALSP